MAVRLLHPAASPHIFRGAQEVWLNGERYDVLNADGISLLADGPAEPTPVPPSLAGGALEVDGDDVVITPPTVTGGRPAPILTLASLTRDNGPLPAGAIAGNRIPGGALGNHLYIAVWSASNGEGQPATRTATLTTVASDPVWNVTVQPGSLIIAGLPPVPLLRATAGANSITIEG